MQDNKKNTITCNYCGSEVENSHVACPYCGAPLQPEGQDETLQPDYMPLPEEQSYDDQEQGKRWLISLSIAAGGIFLFIILAGILGRPDTGTLKINEISGGILYINDENAGSTPAELELAPGIYKAEIEVDGYKPWVREIEIKAGDTITPDIQLIYAKGSLSVPGIHGGEWYLNGRNCGYTPGSIELDEGVYTLEIKADGYEPWVNKIEVTAGETVRPVIKMTRSSGVIKLTSTPAGTWYLNGQKQGKTPAEKEIKAGTYTVKVAAKGYKTWQKKLTLESGRTIAENVTLQKIPQKTKMAAVKNKTHGTAIQQSREQLSENRPRVINSQEAIERTSWEEAEQQRLQLQRSIEFLERQQQIERQREQEEAERQRLQLQRSIEFLERQR